MKFLLDTDTLVFVSKRMGNCLANLEKHLDNHIAISTINLVEIELGIAKSNYPAKALAFLSEIKARFNILTFDKVSDAHSGRVRAQLGKIGLSIGPYDLQHADIALTHNLIFVTSNTSEFERVPGLKLADWYD